jgi:predicted  nucleic acid-binding Zn-ribbon protein
MEHNPFDVLEQKVRQAADTVRRLRAEKEQMEKERVTLRSSVQELEKKVASLEKQHKEAASGGARLEALRNEVDELRHEREEIRHRLARLVDVLDAIE